MPRFALSSECRGAALLCPPAEGNNEMGCDIHLHQEVKINGKWEHYALLNPRRNYVMFARMANVRNYDGELEPIVEPRGIPKDATVLTKYDFKEWEGDAHSASWLSAQEISELNKWREEYKSFPGEKLDIFWLEDWAGYLFGNSWPGFWEYPNDRPAGLEDVRWVFWFDN